MQSPLEQANSFIWQVRLGQFWSSSAALAQSLSPSHTKLNGTQRGWPGYHVGQVNWLELQVRWPAGDREGEKGQPGMDKLYDAINMCKITHLSVKILRANMIIVYDEAKLQVRLGTELRKNPQIL